MQITGSVNYLRIILWGCKYLLIKCTCHIFLDGRAEALLCASNMLKHEGSNLLRKRKKMISEWNCCGKRVSFFSLDSCKLKPIRCLATSSQRNTSHHLLLYKWTLSPNPLGKTLDITWVNIHWQLALTRNSSYLYGNDVGHYLDFEMLHFGQIHFWYVTRQKAQL